MQDYDEQGDYIRTWVPELAKVPALSLFEPWRLSRADQEKYGVQIGVSIMPNTLPVRSLPSKSVSPAHCV